MPTRYAAPYVTPTLIGTWDGGGGHSNYVVQTVGGVLYAVYVDTSSDVAFRKSLDGGLTWGRPTVVHTGTATQVAVWYDRWSNISAGLIHIVYTDSGDDDVRYRTINTESSDALSTATVLFLGATTASPNGTISVARARGGNVYCRVTIDAGAEGGFFRLPNANVPNGAWDAARTVDETLATNDDAIVVPGFAADNQDMMMIFWDASATEISRKIYDDSANSWAEASIATSMTQPSVAYPGFSAAVDLTNSRILVAAWSAEDVANADLRVWTVTESAITEVTNVITNSTDDQGLCSIALDTVNDDWYVFYGGATAGGDTWGTSAHLYVRGSSDNGTTWSSEYAITDNALMPIPNPKFLMCTPRYSGQWCAMFQDDTTIDQLHAIVPITLPVANYQIGT